MPYEVVENSNITHDENTWYHGSIREIVTEESQYGPQLKWILVLDDDGTYTDSETGEEIQKTVWHFCSQKLTTHEKNKFRKIVKGLTGSDPQPGTMFDERHYTGQFYMDNEDADAVALTGKEQPWRIKVMFEHGKKKDGTPKESVSILAAE